MPDRQFTLEDLRRILVDRVGLGPTDVPDDPQVSFIDLGLDSLAVVEVQLAIQQDYGFTVPDEDAERIVTLADAIGYVNAQLAEIEEVPSAARR